MGERDRLGSLVDLARHAAFDEDLWIDWTRRLVDTFDGIGGTFYAFDPASEGVERMIPLWDADGATQAEYAAVWAPFDPQKAHAARQAASTVYTDIDHVDRDDPQVDAFMAWGEAMAGFGHHLGAVSLPAPAASPLRVGFCVHRRVGDGPVPVRHREMLSHIMPALEGAFALGLAHGRMLHDAYWSGLADRPGAEEEAALLLDERGRMIRATAAALAIVRSGDGLSISRGALAAAAPGDTARLEAAVGRALSLAAGAALTLARPSGRAPYVLVVHPLPRRQRVLAPDVAAALVTIVDPAAHAGGNDAMLRDAFGLTPREADLAERLRAGHSTESAAADLGIALPTARLHLRRLFAKTGTARQADLLRLIDRIR